MFAVRRRRALFHRNDVYEISQTFPNSKYISETYIIVSEGIWMLNFTVNIISENEDKRVPVAIAGQIMVDVQSLLSHIGECLMAKELMIQEALEPRLLSKFTLYINSTGSITLNTSSYVPETKGFGNVVDDAVILMEKTLDALGAGLGGYWMEDNYEDPIYRSQIIIDVVTLFEHINSFEGFVLMYGMTDVLKRFGEVNVEKMVSFLHDKGNVTNSTVIGLVSMSASKSRHDRMNLMFGTTKVRLSFANETISNLAAEYADKGPVSITGRLTFSGEGRLVEISGAEKLTPLFSVSFRRMISSTGDIELKAPVDAAVKYEDGIWILTNEELGIIVSKDNWDSAVQQFHDYFVFLWTQYVDKNDSDLSDEEKEVKSFLLRLVA